MKASLTCPASTPPTAASSSGQPPVVLGMGSAILRRFALPVGGVMVAAGALATSAHAAEGGGHSTETLFFIQICILMLVGRLVGELMSRIGQPSVMGYLLTGILLGPSFLGLVWPDLQQLVFPDAAGPKTMLKAVSEFGVLLLLLLTGMETDLKLVKSVGRAAILVSIAGVTVPMICGATFGFFIPAELLPHPESRLVTALFIGTALSISSIKIVAAVVREMDFTRRNLGQIIVASAIMEDTIGWIVVAIAFGIASGGDFSIWNAAYSFAGTAAFLVVSLTVGRRAVHWMIRWANDNFTTEFPVITAVLVVMIVMALTTNLIGVHTVLGAFIAGLLVGESPILSGHIEEQLRGLIVAFFMPVFFATAGLNADLTILADPTLLLTLIALIAIASIGKFAGAFTGGEMAGLNRNESMALACGMNARGSTEVIIGSIGLSMGALSHDLFTMITAMALVTTMAMPPMLRWALSRVPLSRSERVRLQREEMEAKGFVPTIERLLLAVDESPNGKTASRFAGIMAGANGIPVTVLPITPPRRAKKKTARSEEKARAIGERAEAAVRIADEDIAKARDNKEGEDIKPVDLTMRQLEAPVAESFAEEVKKGYDLLFIGLKNAWAKGSFDTEVNRLASNFDGPLALVVGARARRAKKADGSAPMLVAVNGTKTARHAAEVAILLASILERPLTVLYVTESRTSGKGSPGSRRDEEAILKEIEKLAEQSKQTIETEVHADVSPDEAILAETRKNHYDLIVLGVSRRTGDGLFFGASVANILDKSPATALLVAPI